MIKKQGDKWLADIQPGGRGNKRYRKTFSRKADAVQFERQLQAKVISNPDYELPKKDGRKLTDIIAIWFKYYGVTLVSGKTIMDRMNKAARTMGDPVCSSGLSERFARYRSQRLEIGIKPATLNRELLAFKAVFSELVRLGVWKHENPFDALRIVKHQPPKMAYLTDGQLKTLMDALQESKSDAYLVALVCLSTGARWREAQKLTISDIAPGLVTYPVTKGKKHRSVPISDDLYSQLKAVLINRGLTDCYTTFSHILKQTGIELPRGQRTHVLRHTFASHFVMNGGNILTLQKVLGHTSLNMTLRYSHLAPDYLTEVLQINSTLTLR